MQKLNSIEKEEANRETERSTSGKNMETNRQGQTDLILQRDRKTER
jgi:hypothetical protein